MRYFAPLIVLLLFFSTPAFAINAPANFRLTDCSSNTLTWAWDDVAGELGYEVQDNGTDTLVAETGAGVLSTIETGLSPNTTYIRHCHSFDSTPGVVTKQIGNGTLVRAWPIEGWWDYCRSQMLYLQSEIGVQGNITKIRWEQSNAATGSINSCTIYMANSSLTDLTGGWVPGDFGPGIEVKASTTFTFSGAGWFEIVLDTPFYYNNTENLIVTFRDLDGNYLDSADPSWYCTNTPNRCQSGWQDSVPLPAVSLRADLPNTQLVMDANVRSLSAPSNVVAACTLAVAPGMDNTIATFTAQTNASITVQVALNTNPGGTALELFYAKGDPNGPTEAFTSGGMKSSGYSWDINALDHNTSYWFKARAENHAGIFTGNCAITAWSTSPGIPTAFACIGCTSSSLTWGWTNQGGEGFDIYDNDTDTIVIAEIAYDATETVETGLSPNKSYRRYIRAFYDLTSDLENCATITSGFVSSANRWLAQRMYFYSDTYRGYCTFDLNNVSDAWTVIGARLYATCYNQAGAGALMDIRALINDPATAPIATVYSEAGSGTLFVDDSIEHRSLGSKVVTLNSDSYGWVENLVSQGWCAVGIVEDTASAVITEFRGIDWGTVSERPWLEVEYEIKSESAPSNVVEACTLALVPGMGNSPATFTDHTNSSVTVQVALNGNPGGTALELFSAKGDANGPTEAFASEGIKTSGYSWDVTGLDYATSYWFKARAQNYTGIFTGNCAITAWNTFPGTPTNFRLTDCSSTTLTWAWSDEGGEGFDIFDADTDQPVITDISPGAVNTIETGLSPNITYRRFIKTFEAEPFDYYYSENLPVQTSTSNIWWNACVLSMTGLQDGDYLIIATLQGASSTTSGAYSEFRLIDEFSTEIGYGYYWTDRYYYSFIASGILTISGNPNYTCGLQARSTINTYTTDVANAAIVAIMLPTTNYNTLNNATDGTTTSTTWVNHSSLTVTPPGLNDDYLIVHSSNLNHTSASYRGYSRLRRTTAPAATLTEGVREPYVTSEWLCQGGFSILKGISSNIDLAHQQQRETSGTCHSKNVHVTAFRLSDSTWNGYAENTYNGEQSTTSTTGEAAVTRTFTVTKPQNYLIMASCGLGQDIVSTAYWPFAWLEHECSSGTTRLNEMRFDENQDTLDRATFAAVRRINLASGSHTVRLMIRTSNASYNAFAQYPTVVAIPLEGRTKVFSGASNTAEACTLAVAPSMDNSDSTFTAETETSITVQLGLNSNPNGTPMELEYALGDANGPTVLFTSLGTKTSGYSWDVTGLDYGKSYWFKARAQNWRGIWTGYCSITARSTKAGPPDNFRFIDRTDTSITWAWDTRGGLRYNIYDNDTDTVTIGDIPGSATCTVETGLSPNVSYRRYMRAIRIGGDNIYYYAESLSEVSTTSNTVWENVCTLNLTQPPAGDYLLIASMQAKADTALGAYGEFRLVRDETNELNYAMEETDNYFHSFISTEILTASGSDDYKYQLQIQSSLNGWTTAAQNAAIIAIQLPTPNYHNIDNLTQDSTTSASFVRHTGLTVSPAGAGDDYWIIHSSNFRHDQAAVGYLAYSRLYDGSNELTYSARDPYNAVEWYTNGGFSVLKGISSDVTLEDQHHSTLGWTSYDKNVHLAAIRLNDSAWNGYADNAIYTEQTTTSATGVPAATKTFTVTTPQNYLIMGSCGLGTSTTTATWTPFAWLEHDCASGTTVLGEMGYYERDSNLDRASFAGMRRLYLAAGSHTVRVMFRRLTSGTAYARCPAVIAVPLEGNIEELTSTTNAIEVCTLAAVPVIDNTTATFVFSNANNIYAQVDENGNSPGTPIELEYAKGDAGGPTEGFTAAGIQTSGYAWDISGLTLDSSYWFRVRARNWAGLWSNYSDLAVTSTTAAGGASLNTPTGLSYLSCSSTTLTWSWTDTNTDPNESGSDFFNGDNDSIVISGITADGNTTVETGLLPNRTYNRYIRAYINLGEKKYSSLSSIVTGNTLGAVPGKPQFFTITTTSATISWSRNGNPSYTVFELARSDGGPWNTRTTTTGLNFGDIGLVADSTYWYRVRSVNLDGLPSDWSENDSLTTLPPGDPVVSVFSGPMLVYGPTASPPLSFTCDQDADFQVQLGGDGSPFSGAFLYSGSVTAGVPENQVFDRDVDLNPDNIPLEIYVTCSDPGNTSKFGFAQCAVYDDHLAPTSDVTYPSDGMFTATLDVISGNALDTGGANVGLVELVLLDETDGRYYDNASNAFDSLSPLPFAVTNSSESWSTNASLIVFTDAHVYKVASLATDTVGNVGPYSANTSFTIDEALPDLTINSPPDASTTVIGPTVNADVQFQVDEDCDYFLQIGGNGTIGSGIDVGSGVALADTPYDVSIPATSFADDAVEHLYITVRSQANLAVVFKYRDFHDDQTPPITSVSTTLSGVMDPPPPLISGSSSDDKAGVGTVELGIRDEYGLYFDPVSGWFKPGTTWILASGTNLWNYDTNDVRWKNDVDYTISIRVTDLVGNVESRVVGMFTAVAPVTGGGFAGGGGGGGGCFLATACYESRVPSPGSLVVRNRTGIYYISQADFEKLQTLRTFRDGVLSRYSLGRTFIRWYYRASPPLAGSIRCRPAAKTLTRWFVVTPAYLLAREALAESYMLRTLAFIMLLSALVFYRRRKSALTHAPVCREPTRPDR